MKRIFCLSAVFLLFSISAFGQANLDPGLQDSVIIGDIVWTESDSMIVPIWFVSDDTVTYLYLPLKWDIPGAFSGVAVDYHPPLNSWDGIFDSCMTGQNRFFVIGWADLSSDSIPNFPLLTNETRVNAMTLRFGIVPNTINGRITIDTTYDPLNGSVAFGLADGIAEFRPAVVAGSYLRITGINDDGETPTEFSLSQNYPNPFNAQTTISYSLSQAGPVTLSIYNIMGQKVATLVDGMQDAGEHNVVWNASDMPSGIYFCRLAAQSRSQNIRMIYLK